MTPHQLYEWASAAIPNIHFEYSTMQDYERESVHLEERFVRSCTIPGTRKYHSFVPVSKDKVKVSFYSNSVAYMEERVQMAQNDLQLESIVGFVTSKMDCKWWLSCVIEVIQANSCVTLTLLHPHGPSASFKFPASPDVCTVPLNDILTLVDPRTTTGYVYTLSKKETSSVTESFKHHYVDSFLILVPLFA